MINKFLSDISRNPSSYEQVGLLEKKLKREKTLLKASLVFLSFCLILLFWIDINHKQERNVDLSNNITSGISSKQDLIRKYDLPDGDLPEIYNIFGISRQDLVNLPDFPDTEISVNEVNNFWGAYRQPLKNQYFFDSQELTLSSDSGSIYFKPLYEWKNIKDQKFNAFKGRSSQTGEAFWLLEGSGNYVQVGKVVNEAPPVKASLLASGSIVEENEESLFVVQYQNISPGSVAEDVRLTGTLNLSGAKENKYDQVLNLNQDGTFELSLGNVNYSEQPKNIVIKLEETPDPSSFNCFDTELLSSNTASTKISASSKNCLSKETSPVFDKAGSSLSFDKVSNGEYSLNLRDINRTGQDILNYSSTVFVGDLLDYLEIDSPSLLNSDGIFDSENETVTWITDLDSGSSISRNLKFTTKDSLPTTPSSVYGTAYDCEVSLRYGNQISHPINCPKVKDLEFKNSMTPVQIISIFTLLFLVTLLLFFRVSLHQSELSKIKKNYQHRG